RRFDEAWDKFWDKFGKNIKSATVSAGDRLDDLSDKVNRLVMRFDLATGGSGRSALSLIYGTAVQQGEASRLTQGDAQKYYEATGRGKAPFEASEPAPTGRLRITVNRPTVDVDPAKQKADASRYQQMIGLLGQTATATEQVTSFEKQLQLAWLTTGVSIPKERTAVIKKMIEEQALGITQIKASADAQRLEADAIGMSVGQSTAYLAVQNAILDARRRGQTLTQDNIAAIEREAAALGAAAQRTDNLKSRYDIAKGAFTTFRQEIAQGAGVWDALAKAGISALDKIGAKLGDLAFDQAWQMFFGSSGAASGGASGGGIFASLGKLLGFARGGYTGDVGRQAVAGVVHGEEFVVNAQATARHRPLLEALNDNRLPGYEDGGYVGPPPSNVVAFPGTASGGTVPIQVTYAPVYNVQGRGAEIDELRAQIARDRAEAPAVIVQTIKEAQSRRMI
ncbi:hypothetical protein RA307_23095, partial [Xanthobacteraceae bacterium Astr-EGSB]|nr:hypothetical protein [Xanthobacteraceae bacterium Astr-EGSB]